MSGDSSPLSKKSQNTLRSGLSRDQQLDPRPRAATGTLRPGQGTDQTISKFSARNEPRRQPHSGKPRPRDKRPPPWDNQGERRPPKARWRPPLSLLPREPPPGPQKRDKDVAAPTPRSGNLREACGSSRDPGRRVHLAGRGKPGMGRSEGQRSQLSARSG